MADIAVTAADVRAVEIWEAFTGPAAEAMDAGCPVYLNTDGLWAKADGNGAGTTILIGLALNTITYVGETLTVMAQGLIDIGDGMTGSAYGTPIYLSNNVGRIATDVGAAILVGRIFPVWGAVTPADKLLRVNPTP